MFDLMAELMRFFLPLLKFQLFTGDEQVKFNTSTIPLRSFIKSLCKISSQNQAAIACLLASFLLQFHQDVTDQVAISLGQNKRPIYVVNTSSHAGQVINLFLSVKAIEILRLQYDV